MENIDTKPYCPLIDERIDCIVCMENRDIKDEYIPKKFKEKENWKDICEKCKYHEY